MQASGIRKQRAAVFLMIVLLHGLIIETVLRNDKKDESIKAHTSSSLLVYFFSPISSAINDAPRPDSPRKELRKNRGLKTEPSPGVEPAPSTNVAPTMPPIDWQAELELAARNSESEADKSDAYRDLSNSMSPAQLDWIRQHHMEPAAPGIVWKNPRVEITKNGLPIVHINDHCVLVPIYLFPMVFCTIGHIEPNGDLFKHMREPPH